VGFLTAGILLVFTNALSARQALELLDVPVVLFVGSMVSIARVLETNGQMDVVSRVVSAISIGVPGPAMVAGVIVVSCILANLLNNSASVVLMAPLVVRLASSGGTPATSDALLMAVAAGASLATVLPTHQAVVTAVSRGDITPREFIRAGSVLTLAAVAVAAAVVSVVWM
jgi:di/tricarboxylate transporter